MVKNVPVTDLIGIHRHNSDLIDEATQGVRVGINITQPGFDNKLNFNPWIIAIRPYRELFKRFNTIDKLDSNIQ